MLITILWNTNEWDNQVGMFSIKMVVFFWKYRLKRFLPFRSKAVRKIWKSHVNLFRLDPLVSRIQIFLQEMERHYRLTSKVEVHKSADDFNVSLPTARTGLQRQLHTSKAAGACFFFLKSTADLCSVCFFFSGNEKFLNHGSNWIR